MADTRFTRISRKAPEGPVEKQVEELSKRIGELSNAIEALTRVELYIQAVEPNIAQGKLVIWRDTVGAVTYALTRVSGTQYKVAMP